MRLIESASEVAELISRAKADAPGYVSNFYPGPPKLQGWITHGELFCEQRDGSALFLRKDRDFWHLSFCTPSSESLQRAVTALPLLATEPVVVDLVGSEAALVGLTALFETTGFRRYKRLLRLARIVTFETPSLAAPPDPRVVLAGQADGQSILDLLLRSFDQRAEQIPKLHEIEAAVAAGQIWVVWVGGGLAGLLFFETQGLTSTLRYWLIAPEFRALGLGAGLMRRYFAEHAAVRRFLLWVVADNVNAIAKYEHYSFAPDGLVDQVLATEMTSP
jgi:GNAT superfamily N-acetyltransferase